MKKTVSLVLSLAFALSVGFASTSGPACRLLADAESSQVRGAKIVLSSYWVFDQCTEIERCKSFTCGNGVVGTSCDGNYQRDSIPVANIFGCGEPGGGNFFTDCEEFWVWGANRQCSTYQAWCASFLDEDDVPYCAIDHTATGSIIEADAPGFCITWF